VAWKCLSANLIICELVLKEESKVQSAIRIMDRLTIGRPEVSVDFSALTLLTSNPGDFSSHILRVQLHSDTGVLIADTSEQLFAFENRFDQFGIGAYTLTTNFTLQLSKVPLPGRYAVWAFLDGIRVAGAPLTLLRA
jgi:hypothetical protein